MDLDDLVFQSMKEKTKRALAAEAVIRAASNVANLYYDRCPLCRYAGDDGQHYNACSLGELQRNAKEVVKEVSLEYYELRSQISTIAMQSIESILDGDMSRDQRYKTIREIINLVLNKREGEDGK